MQQDHFRPSTPVRKKVLLSSESPTFTVTTWTQHTYKETRREPDPDFGELRPQWRHYFTCDETGHERAFGSEGPNYLGERP